MSENYNEQNKSYNYGDEQSKSSNKNQNKSENKNENKSENRNKNKSENKSQNKSQNRGENCYECKGTLRRAHFFVHYRYVDAALEAMHTRMYALLRWRIYRKHLSESLEHLASDNGVLYINITHYTRID